MKGKRGFQKGESPWNKGKKGAQIAWNKGLTKDTDERIKKHSQEWKNSMSKKMSGINHPMYEKPRSEETRNRISQSQKGFHNSPRTEFKVGLRKGIKFSKEHKKKMSLARMGWNPSEETRLKMKKHRATQIFPKNDTSIEVKIQNFLKELEITFFTHQYLQEIEHAYQCDILIPSMNLVIECDGNYFHKYPIGRDIDKIRTSELIDKGFKVLRLWEHEIKIMNIEDFQEKIKCQNK